MVVDSRFKIQEGIIFFTLNIFYGPTNLILNIPEQENYDPFKSRILTKSLMQSEFGFYDWFLTS